MRNDNDENPFASNSSDSTYWRPETSSSSSRSNSSYTASNVFSNHTTIGDNMSELGDRDNFDPNSHPLKDYCQPMRTTSPSCIVFPYNAGQFHFRNGMITLLPQFHGMDNEKPYTHLKDFEDVCSTFSDQPCSEDVLRLKLFPFSLKDNAKTWLKSLRPRTIRTWHELQAQFLKKYFPMHRTSNLKAQIQSFQ